MNANTKNLVVISIFAAIILAAAMLYYSMLEKNWRLSAASAGSIETGGIAALL